MMFTIESQADIDRLFRHAQDVGHGFGALPRESRPGELELQPGVFASTAEEKMPLIPEVEWKERIAEMTAKKQWPKDKWSKAGLPAINQNGYGWCWAASGGQALMMTRLLRNMKPVNLGWEMATELVGYANKGYYLDKWIAWVAKNGIPERSFVPDLKPRSAKAGWKENAANYKPDALEVWDGGDGNRKAKAVSMLLSEVATPYFADNGMAHAMTYWMLYYDSRGRLCAEAQNTWGPNQEIQFVGDMFEPDELFGMRVIPYYDPT